MERCLLAIFTVFLMTGCTEQNQLVTVKRQAEFFEGQWQSTCNESVSGALTTSFKIELTLTNTEGNSKRYDYDDTNCTEHRVLGFESNYRVAMGKKIITSDGEKATELDFIFDDASVFRDIAYYADNALYFGIDVSDATTRAKQLNFADPYTRIESNE